MDGLTPKDISEVRKAYVLSSELEQQIERAKACNFECSDIDQRCQLAKDTCKRIIDQYGPTFPIVRE